MSDDNSKTPKERRDRAEQIKTWGRMVERFAPKSHDEVTREAVLDGAKAAACGRDDVYGHPRDSHRVVARFWSVYLSESFDADVELTPRQAADMLDLLKDARKVTGPTPDCYVDGAGYNGIGGELLADENPEWRGGDGGDANV